MNADLLRQRRNLIGISSVLLIFDFANVQVAKVSLLGTELLIGNATVLAICAWVVWFYFLVRYYQYLRAEPAHLIRDTFMLRIEKYIRSHHDVRHQDNTGQPIQYKICCVRFAKWNYVSQEYDPARGDVVDSLGIQLSLWRLCWWSVKTTVFVCIQTSYATDRMLPFVLAVAAPLVTLYTKW